MKELLEKTFGNEFIEANYKELILNLFNSFDFSKEHTLKHQFTETERQKLKDFIYLGTFEDTDNKSLDVLIVELKGGSKVERARSLQRNLIGKYLKTNLKDSALVAFYSKDNPDWRLSFVKMDYKITDKGVKVDIGTSPKRYSFLVGKTEPSHTAKKQFLPLLTDKVTPTVEEIEKAFSVEKVTKEFYIEIAKKFTELVGGERKIGSKKIIEKGFLKLPSTIDDTVKKEFAVRLIGRLLFCWFLKKKKSDDGIPLIPNEILSSDAIRQYPNYYHSLLEPLFFQVLNTPIENRKKEFRNELWDKIPFLNGGLFEPHRHDHYELDELLGTSKHINTLKVPDKWFKELFEVFEIYNFTIDESTTIDVDISVDPEMLGKIFENLLAEINPETGETARKSTGSYYTPRPIVEYMVDESLKQYLKTQTGITEGKLSKLLSYTEDDTGLTESEKDSIIDALDRVKIIDPACGSGAFPMGILHKMLLILQKIDPESKKWLSKKIARIDNKILRKEVEKKLKAENWDYVHKLGIIQNSIYGVDIQPIAVEISKLRFFLSLIVDEKIDDNKYNRGIEPLPNLEFKFVCANSLIGLPKFKKEETIDLSEATQDIQKLKDLRDAYFTSYGADKRRIEQEFKEIQDRMFEHTRNWMAYNKKSLDTQTLRLSLWNPFSNEPSSWFDPEWMFGIRDGFDIVIANPPYVRQELIKPLKPKLKEEFGEFFISTADIYTYFYARGLNLLKRGGILCYISANKFMRAAYGKNTRQLLIEKALPLQIIDFGDLPIFEATIYPTVVLAKKDNSISSCRIRVLNVKSTEQLKNISETFRKNSFTIKIGDLSTEGWILEHPEALALIKKFNAKGIPLGKYVDGKLYRGILTGFNKAFVIDEDTRKRLIAEDSRSKDIIKPWLRGRDVKKWKTEWAKFYVISIASSANKTWPWSKVKSEKEAKQIFSKEYPAIFTHLSQYEDELRRRDDQGRFWWELRSCEYYKVFEKPKITWGNLATHPKFAFDPKGFYVCAPANIIPTDDLYLLAILNSPICEWLIKLQAAARSGGFLEYKPMYVAEIPIKVPTENQKKSIEKKVEMILADPDNSNVSLWEAEINKLIYDIYELTIKEIEIVESFSQK
jgi:hypothetical protein